MAVPTITSISPDEGPAQGGNAVIIEGSNFRLWTPPAAGYVGGVAGVNVSVTFGGAEATRVRVDGADRLHVTPPEYAGNADQATFPAVDIVVTNLDDAGLAIPAESVAEAASYTFKRNALRKPTLEIESPFTRISRELMQGLKRQLLLTTSSTTHTDFSEDGISLLQAGIPTLQIDGPDVMDEPEGWENPDIEEEQGDGNYSIWPNPLMHALSYSLTGQSDNEQEFLTLIGTTIRFFRKNPYLVIAGDVPANSTVRMPLILTDKPEKGPGVLNSNLHVFSCAFEVRRVPVLYLPPSEVDVFLVDTLELQTQNVNGTLVEIKTL